MLQAVPVLRAVLALQDRSGRPDLRVLWAPEVPRGLAAGVRARLVPRACRAIRAPRAIKGKRAQRARRARLVPPVSKDLRDRRVA